jgi:hypothetical protein
MSQAWTRRRRMPAVGKLMAAATLALAGSGAVAGPPYNTDDPATTDTGHWEIYAFAAGTGSNGSFDGNAGLDLSYGIAPDVQLTTTLPIDFARNAGGTHAGAGDVEIGVKYRFFHREEAGIAVAVFPRVFVPTASRRFGSGRVAVLLPVWAQKDFGPWSLFGGGGYTINPGRGNRNFWQTGLALTRTLTPRLSLGAEITHQDADVIGGRAKTALGFGGIYRLGGPFSILVSGGPLFEHHRAGAQLQIYTGIGVNF